VCGAGPVVGPAGPVGSAARGIRARPCGPGRGLGQQQATELLHHVFGAAVPA
jgi:hypothetical protein